MEYIFITLKINKNYEEELKVPANITAGQFLDIVQNVFNLQGKEQKSLHVEPLGRILGAEEIFCDEGVFNGSQITLV